ncbi:helix-turn-helix domain-containing protein [Streptomyces sp. NBC_00536]|uniref:helix-turn-helix domain-containing protein n=1 Tax=Streptomyces sp. NBC_00536 TaxID=2975769 RepID=UPI002E803CC3|nr:helix-turn-helix domain-containing protein [Streptomyces sp. NBC_00536]WUC78942.1 helix-turn-helix domain-containing protein [Streptomyces sp. NBC_00536]
MTTKTVAAAIKKAIRDELLSPRQVESEYGFSVQTLANWRWTEQGPDYIKTSPGRGGRIRYKRSAIERWLDERTVSGGAAA